MVKNVESKKDKIELALVQARVDQAAQMFHKTFFSLNYGHFAVSTLSNFLQFK